MLGVDVAPHRATLFFLFCSHAPPLTNHFIFLFFNHPKVVAAVSQSFADKVTDSFNKFNYSSVPWDAIAHKVNSGECGMGRAERKRRGKRKN